MKNVKLLLLTLAASALLLFAGCKAETEPLVTPEPDPAAPVTDPGAPVSDPEAEAAHVSVAIASPELLGGFADYEEFSEFAQSGEEPQKLIFTTDAPVKDFKFFTADFDEVDENIVFKVGEELFAAEKFTPESPVVIAWMDIGLIPNRGISYVDADGTTKYFTITQSGNDGSILLIEFAPAD